MIDLKEYTKNQIIINNKEIILNINNNERIIKLNKENNYLNLLNNLITNINLTFKYSLQSCGSMYYDYFKNNEKEEINKYNLTNYLVNCILYYVYNFEKDKINDLNKIICYNFIYKKDENINNNIEYIRIFFKRTFFKDIFNLNLNLKINFSNLYFKEDITNVKINNLNINNINIHFDNLNKTLYYKSLSDNLIYNHSNNYNSNNSLNFIRKKISFNCNLNNTSNYLDYIINIYKNNKNNENNIEYINDCKNYLNIKNSILLTYLNDKINFIKIKYNINLDDNKYALTKTGKGNLIKDENNEVLKDDNYKYITIGRRYVLYFKLNEDIDELDLKQNEYLGIISENCFNCRKEQCNNIIIKYIKQNNYYIVKKKQNFKKWEIINTIDNNNIIYDHDKTISNVLNYYNNHKS